MKKLLLLALLIVTPALFADEDRRPGGDIEKIPPYACLCGCHDWQVSCIRVRLPGGGYGCEWGHLPMLNPARGNYAEFLVPGVNDRYTCRAIRSGNCWGVRGRDDLNQPGGPRYTAGFLSNCRYTIDWQAP